MTEVWRAAARRAEELGDEAAAYDRYRPRYPAAVFDDIIELADLRPGASAIEVGAGTGIATQPLVERGLEVTAIEPSAAMAAVGEAKLRARARWIVGRFEDGPIVGPGDGPSDEQVDLVVSFNAWHWVEPGPGCERLSAVLRPGGSVALVWTEVTAWGSDEFETGLADEFGAPWPKTIDAVLGSRGSIAGDARFGPFDVRRHRFERTLDAPTFVAVTRTYGGEHSEQRDEILAGLVEAAGGNVTKVEEAVLFLAQRR